jgi:hypothetical protein
MSIVRIIPAGIEELATSRGMERMLRAEAETVADRVDAPSHLRVWVKAGKGPQGMFSQVIMEGPGALTEEFGSRTRAPRAPLRRALKGGR